MSCDGYTTGDIAFASALMYVFGDESLTKIAVVDYREKHFVLDAPSLDCQSYLEDFKAGNFAISDLKSYMRTYDWITRILRDMRKKSETEWVSNSWIAGRNSKGERVL